LRQNLSRFIQQTAIAGSLAVLAACSETEQAHTTTAGAAPAPAAEPAAVTPEEQAREMIQRRFGGTQLPMPADVITVEPLANARREAYFGDLHVHTTYSFDAFAFGTLATPDDAYRYARGEPIKHPAGFDVQLKQPLDFYAVTDHAMFLGAVREAANPETEFAQYPTYEFLHNLDAPENLNAGTLQRRGRAFNTFLQTTLTAIVNDEIDIETVDNIARTAWADTVRAAQDFNKPGEFTTFVAYEYTSSTDDRGNLHRNVIFRDADRLPSMPFSRFHSQNPEGLWDWQDGLREQGIESLAIPHNSNGSNGQMFKLVDWAGNPIDDAYARQRMRNEPIIEITQVKGTSETHPALSDTDEWADFEIMPYRVASPQYSEPSGSYAREALLNGLAFEDKGLANPYKFGFVGASDTHTGAISDVEETYFSKVGILDATGALRGSVPLSEDRARQIKEAGRGTVKEVDGNSYSSGASETWGASGVTGVWAEENSRGAIYDAFRRKETFATSGPRIRVRFFGGYGFDDAVIDAPDVVEQAYATGVSMGSELLADDGAAPQFVAWASRDAHSQGLQRLQIIKGWTVNGQHHEKVFDVACSDGGTPDPATNRCPDNGARVNITDCSVTPDKGDAELKTVWTDPEFDPALRAFYYVRALENPSCRWSTWDAIRANVAPRSDLQATIQERAWTSPIWYVP
jgi:hypothetical protein